MRLAAIGLVAVAACATSKTYESFDDVPYGYERERTIWSPRAQLEIRVAELGDPNSARPPIVLLHPWGFNMLVWRDVAKQLAEDRLVLLVDLPAHGKSLKLHTYYPMRRLAVAVLDAAKDLDEFYVAGNSLGGATALAVAIEAPERLRGMILMGAPGGAKLPMPMRRAARSLAKRAALRSLSDEAWLLGLAGTLRSDTELANRLFDDLMALRGAREWRAWCHSAILVLYTAAEYAPDLSDVHVPALVVHGEDDLLIWRPYAEALAKGLPDAALTILEDCGHMSEVDCPDLVTARIRAFIDAQALGTPPP